MASIGTLAATEAADTLAAEGGKAWTPSELSIGPVLWYDAASPPTITLNGSGVSQLNDRGAAGFNLVQGTASRQPAFGAASFNGRPGIQFDGAGDFLARVSTSSTGLFGAAGTTGNLFVVGRYTSGVVWFKWQSATTNRFGMEGAARWDYPNDVAGTGQFNTFTGWNGTENAIFCYNSNGTTKRVYKNGVESLSSQGITSGITAATGELSIGADNGGFNSSNFLLAEILLLAYPPTEEQRQLIEGYLAHKWGLEANLSSNHPWRIFPPMADVTPPGLITGSATGSIGDGIEASASVSATNFATLAVTEASDTVAATSRVRLAGSVAVTEAADTVVATGALVALGTGSLIATEAADTVAASGSLRLVGSLSATEAADTVAATGRLQVFASLSATEASDAVAAQGVLSVSGAVSVVEADDVAAAAGALRIAGSFAVAEAADTASATGALRLSGSVSLAEASDAVAATGAVIAIGSGSVLATEQDDTVAGVGALRIVGASAIAEANDTLAAVGRPILGATLAATEASDTIAAAGTLPITGFVFVTEASDTLSTSGTAPIVGALSAVEASDAVIAFGTLPLVASASITEAADTLAAAASLLTVGNGTLSVVEADDTVGATGRLRVAGTVAITEASDGLQAASYRGIREASLNVTEANDNVVALSVLITARTRGRSSSRPASRERGSRPPSVVNQRRSGRP